MDKNLNQDLQKELRREALKRNWRLFKQSKLGMIGLYIVIFFLFLALLQPFYLLPEYGTKEYTIQLLDMTLLKTPC